MKWKPGRKNFLYLAAALALTLVCLILVSDANLYSKTIVKVTQVQTRQAGQSRGENGITEKQYTQRLAAVVQNGKRKGEKIVFTNQYTASQTKTTRYRAGDRLFVRLGGGNAVSVLSVKRDVWLVGLAGLFTCTLFVTFTNQYTASQTKTTRYRAGDRLFVQLNGGNAVSVLSVKRDIWLVGLAGLFACTLFFFYRGRGFLILLSVLVNVALMAFVLVRGNTDAFFAWQWPLLIAAFCVLTLLAVGGFRRKTLGTIVSTLSTALLVGLLYQVTVNRGNVIPYDMMEDALGSAPIEDIFRFSVIAGSIGAIMDVAVAIHASVEKMAADGALPEGKAMRASLREIGGDVMGTMINVLFFSYISASLPICILKIASGYAVSSIFSYDLIFDFTRFLLGAIGIVLAIPVSEGVALLMCRCGRRRTA